MGRSHPQTPEFHIVVRRPGRGPLAPYRFAIAIAFAMAIGGSQLWTAAQTGEQVDMALGRAGVAGLFAWLLLGRVNSILKAAEPPPRPAEDAVDAETGQPVA